ncbi:MAG: DUF4942 domain-containing protein [Treponema sp.]|nr:DUF4942 domain-containing protein [Treponema sp.]
MASATAQKLQLLRSGNEDYEWYPTTAEIMEAMKKDIWDYLRSHNLSYREDRDSGIRIDTSRDEWDEKKKKYKEITTLSIDSFLDVGAGDGRVLDCLNEDQGGRLCKKYGIEIARAQADDLIRRGVFIIGRNFWDVTLIDQHYALIYSNPPFSQFEHWACKILYEGSFNILYLVMPKRWIDSKLIHKELKDRYEYKIIGDFNFSEADREARGTVNLVRINAEWRNQTESGTTRNGKSWKETYHYQNKIEDAFARFVRENIADFKETPESEWNEEEITAVALKQTPIEQLISDYEIEKKTLGDAFIAIGKLDAEIIKLLGQDKKSMLEIIRKTFKRLRSKYWRAAFEKLEPVKDRMIRKTRENIFNNIKEFKTLDFNADNIYSIIIWIINNCNIGILDQIGEVFDALTDKDFITEYKSNRHWTKGTWRHTQSDYKYKELPARWKLGLDYRIVVSTYGYRSYGTRYTIVDDFIIICSNLGFPIDPCDTPDYEEHQTEQKFHTVDGELAFTMRYYTGNKNAHLKINKRLLMKFNIEVAKIRKWMSDPDDVVEEFDIPKDEATRLWNSGLVLIGNSDVKMLEHKPVKKPRCGSNIA